jgi:hypothetical protein
VRVLGGSGEQSENVHRYCREFWQYRSAPRQLLASDPIKRATRLVWGNSIEALMASQRSVRGPHPQRLRLDEIDTMDMAIFDAAMGQPMQGDSGIPAQTVASSTHQYADGTMTKVLGRAAEMNWPVYEWCYKESSEPHGWLLNSEIERKRGEVTAVMWNVEYDLQEPSPESRAISTEHVRRMFDKGLGNWEGRPGEYLELEPPQENARYSTGADWARKVDWTVITTIRTDCRPMRIVAFERCQRLPWPVMVRKLDDRMRRYRGRGMHDGTGLGDVVEGYLTTGVTPFIMVGRARSDLLSEYISAIERDEILSPHIRFMEAEHRLASVDDVYGSGHLPDSIAAGALAYRASQGGWVLA